MNEKRERYLAAILARGLMRVRQCAERAGRWKSPDDEQPQLTQSKRPPAVDSTPVKDQGEQQ